MSGVDRSAFKDTCRLRLDVEVRKEERGVYETIVRTAPVPIVITDTAGRVVIWNEAAELIFGWSEEEAIGDLPPQVAGENVEEFQSLVARAARGETIRGVKTRRAARDGRVVYLDLNLAPIRSADGRIVGTATVMADITPQKHAEEALWRSEQRFEAFMENFPGNTWMKDLQGRYVYANRAARSWPGFESCLGKSDFALVSEELAQARGESDLLALQSDSMVQTVEVCVRHNELRQILVHRFPIVSAAGVPVLIGGIGLDITEQRRVETALTRAGERLEMLSRRLFDVREEEKRHIARELHDEIGQSLTALKFGVDVALRTKDCSGLALRREDLLAMADQLISTVRALSLSLHPPLLDEMGLIAALRENVLPQARRAGLDVLFRTNEFQARLDAALEIAIFRVVQEAVTNVLRHAAARSIDIALQCREGWLEVTVRDDGAGFDAASAVEHLSNFGMLSMRERVELCGGQFSCESTSGEGTVIRVTFPLRNSLA